MPRRLAKDGGTAKSPPPSIPASTRLLGPASNWWKKVSMPCLSASEYCLGPDVAAADVPNLPFPDHCHRLVQQHELEIAVADREHQIPPDSPQDHLGSELPPFEGPILPYLNRLSTSCHATASTRPGRRRKAATEPRYLLS